MARGGAHSEDGDGVGLLDWVVGLAYSVIDACAYGRIGVMIIVHT